MCSKENKKTKTNSQIDVKKRENLKKAVFGAATIGAGLIGLSSLTNADIIFRNNTTTKTLTELANASESSGAFETGAGGDQSAKQGSTAAATGAVGAFAQGLATTAQGSWGSFAQGTNTTASGQYGSFAQGGGLYGSTIANGNRGSFAQGMKTTATGNYGSFAQGEYTTATGSHGSFAQGGNISNPTKASGNDGSFAQGYNIIASGNFGSFAQGKSTTASGHNGCFAQGIYTKATGAVGAFAQGQSTTASGQFGSLSQGHYTTATGNYGSFAQGADTTASGHNGCFAQGSASIATGSNGCAQFGPGTNTESGSLQIASGIRLANATPVTPKAGDIWLDAGTLKAHTSGTSGVEWGASGGGGSPAGSDTEIQFNNLGSFGADSNLVWDNTNKRLGIGVTPLNQFHNEHTATGDITSETLTYNYINDSGRTSINLGLVTQIALYNKVIQQNYAVAMGGTTSVYNGYGSYNDILLENWYSGQTAFLGKSENAYGAYNKIVSESIATDAKTYTSNKYGNYNNINDKTETNIAGAIFNSNNYGVYNYINLLTLESYENGEVNVNTTGTYNWINESSQSVSTTTTAVGEYINIVSQNSFTNMVSTGILIDQIGGATKRGIVLKQDSDGGDIIFGAGQDARIYYDGINLHIDAALVGSGTVILDNIPISDPLVAGGVWNDSGTLKISNG